MALEEKTILLTGATGFVGSRVLSFLVNTKFNIIVLVRKHSDLKRINDYINDISIVELNEENENSLRNVFEKNDIDYVIHLATHYGGETSSSDTVLDSNVVFPLKLLEYGLKYRLKGFINTDTFYPSNYSYLNDYARSKNIFSKCLSVYASQVKIINLKLQHVYGINDQSFKFIPSTIRFLLNSSDDLLLTKGEQKRDFIYVDDVASAYINALKLCDDMTVREHNFDIGSGVSISLSSLVKNMAKMLGVPDKRLNLGALPYREHEIMSACADNSDFSELTGWKPQVNIDQGLERTIEWIKSHNETY